MTRLAQLVLVAARLAFAVSLAVWSSRVLLLDPAGAVAVGLLGAVVGGVADSLTAGRYRSTPVSARPRPIRKTLSCAGMVERAFTRTLPVPADRR